MKINFETFFFESAPRPSPLLVVSRTLSAIILAPPHPMGTPIYPVRAQAPTAHHHLTTTETAQDYPDPPPYKNCAAWWSTPHCPGVMRWTRNTNAGTLVQLAVLEYSFFSLSHPSFTRLATAALTMTVIGGLCNDKTMTKVVEHGAVVPASNEDETAPHTARAGSLSWPSCKYIATPSTIVCVIFLAAR